MYLVHCLSTQDINASRMAKKIPRPGKLKELLYLRTTSVKILEFLATKDNNPIYSQFVEIVERAYASQNLRGLRTVSNDIVEWSKGLSKSDRINLDNVISGELSKIDKQQKDGVARILNRGRISSEDEYRLVQG